MLCPAKSIALPGWMDSSLKSGGSGINYAAQHIYLRVHIRRALLQSFPSAQPTQLSVCACGSSEFVCDAEMQLVSV